MRPLFDEQLAELDSELVQMGALCEQAIAVAAKALLSAGATEKAAAALSERIARSERGVESLCLKLLLQQQPVARDLRQVSAALKMITDMQRIGDQAADIEEIALELGAPADNPAIGEMARAAVGMLTDSVDAFVHRDPVLAAAVGARDDRVDALFVKLKKQAARDTVREPQQAERAVDVLMAAKHLERIADHAVNIAEWVVFSLTGVHKGEKEL